MFRKIRQLLAGSPNLGLEPLPKDNRDLKVGFWFGTKKYEPKRISWKLPRTRVFRQRFNCCGWYGSTTGKEMDEGINLSPRSLVIAAKRVKYLSKDGYSNLRNNELAVKDFGIAEERLLKDGDGKWNEFSSPRHLTPEILINAKEHRSASFWRVDTLEELYKALDDGRPVKFGMDWYRGFNRSGGFKAPYLISGPSGRFAGGHAPILTGYERNYFGKKVVEFKNSFGDWWGDKGYAYIEEEYLLKNMKKYGAFVNMDMPSDVGKFIVDNDGKNIKAKGHPGIYRLQKGKKKPYTSWLAYLAWNTFDKGWVETDKNIIDGIKNGDVMDVKKSSYWAFLRKVKEDKQLDTLLELLLKDK